MITLTLQFEHIVKVKLHEHCTMFDIVTYLKNCNLDAWLDYDTTRVKDCVIFTFREKEAAVAFALATA